jgi:hypothetical protein
MTSAPASELRARALLSVQRALIGEVTPEMRAIEVVVTSGRVLLRVFTDGEAPARVRDDFDAGAATQIVADFPYPEDGDPEVAVEFVRCDFPEPIPVEGVLVHAFSGVRFAHRREIDASAAPAKQLERSALRDRHPSQTIRHFHAMGNLVQKLATVPAELVEHQFNPGSFGSWLILLRHRGRLLRVLFDGRDSTCRLERVLNQAPLQLIVLWENVAQLPALLDEIVAAIRQAG